MAYGFKSGGRKKGTPNKYSGRQASVLPHDGERRIRNSTSEDSPAKRVSPWGSVRPAGKGHQLTGGASASPVESDTGFGSNAGGGSVGPIKAARGS